MKASSRQFFVMTVAIPALLIAFATAWWARTSWKASHQAVIFKAITEGDSRSLVVAALGTPDLVRPCGDSLWWGGDAQYRGKNDGRCVTEERYEFFLSAFGVGYSKTGHVVSKYQYVSE